MTLDLSHMSDDQRAIQARCVHPTGNFVEFPAEALEQSLVKRFEEQVDIHSDRLAVKFGQQELSYRELNIAANRLAHALLTQRNEPKEPVVLLFENSLSAIVSILAVLKADKFYAGVNATYPRTRVKYMMDDLRAKTVLTDSRSLALAQELSPEGATITTVDDIANEHSDENPNLTIDPDSSAWIVYTSGSTGQPKGVVQTHRNVLQFTMNYVNYYHLVPEDRSALLFAYGGTAWAHEIFMNLLNGSSLIFYDLKLRGLSGLGDFLVNEKITICKIVSTAFRHFTETLEPRTVFSDVRLVVLGGEAVYPVDVDGFKKAFPRDSVLVNRIGCSETGSIFSYFIDHDTEIDGNNVPIGNVWGGNQVTLLGEDGHPVGDNEIGEVAVRSRYLSPGYWRKPEITIKSFLPDQDGENRRIYLMGDVALRRPDGLYQHMGRKDFQVKIRGYRVEVAEVELALLERVEIKDAVVTMHEDRTGDGRLAAYVVPSGVGAVVPSRLRSYLTGRLPSYMIPFAFVVLDELPLLPNGKTDRLALPDPGRDRPEIGVGYVAPQTPIERKLTEIWAEVLDIDDVGVDDDFLEIGGDSLKATRILSRAISTFEVEVPLQELFGSPTISDMALVVAQYQATGADDDDISSLLAELEAMSDEQARQQVEGS